MDGWAVALGGWGLMFKEGEEGNGFETGNTRSRMRDMEMYATM